MTPVQRLVANGNTIINFLKDFAGNTAQDVTLNWINDSDIVEAKTFPNIEKFQRSAIPGTGDSIVTNGGLPNLDNSITTGYFKYTDGSTNKPNNGAGHLLVLKNTDGNVVQLSFPTSDSLGSEFYIRQKRGAVWSSWAKSSGGVLPYLLATSANVTAANTHVKYTIDKNVGSFTMDYLASGDGSRFYVPRPGRYMISCRQVTNSNPINFLVLLININGSSPITWGGLGSVHQYSSAIMNTYIVELAPPDYISIYNGNVPSHGDGAYNKISIAMI